jgi:O-antigen/teichoic acid export membrane protein
MAGKAVENTETEKNLKVVAKGAGLVFFGLAFSKILTYVYRLIVARYYGPGDYGLISIGLSVITVLIAIVILGMDSGIIRYVSEFRTRNDQSRLKGAIRTPMKISLPFAVAMATFLFMLAPSFAGLFAKDIETQTALTIIFQIISITLPFSVCYNYLLVAIKGFKRMDYNVYADNIFYSIVLVVSVALFSLAGFGIEGIAWSYAITVIASFLFVFYFFNTRIFRIFGGTKAVTDIRALMKYSVPLFIGTMAGIIIFSFDTIMLGVFKTASDVGVYNAALPTAKIITVFSATFGALFMPIVVEYRTKNMKREISIIYRTITKWIFVSVFPFALLLLLYSRNVLNILFGPEYVSASLALSLLGLAYFVWSFLIVSNTMLLAIDKTKYTTINIVSAAAVNIVLNVMLIPAYGILGAAMATSASTILVVAMDSIFAWRFTRMNPFDFKAIMKSIFSGLISVGLMTLVYRSFGLSSSFLSLIPLFIVFLALYFILLLAFKFLDKNDIFILKEIEAKLGIKIEFIRKLLRVMER